MLSRSEPAGAAPSARAWDRYWTKPRATPPRRSSLGARWAIDLFRATQREPFRLLDAGCGMGRDLAEFAAAGFSVVGVDFSSVALTRARTCLARLPTPVRSRIRLVEGGLVPFLASEASESYDGVFAAATYQTFPRRRLPGMFREVYRVLRPGSLHAFSIRPTTHPDARHPARIPPNGPDTNARISITLFDRALLNRLESVGFERVELKQSTSIPLWYVAERKPPKR